MGDCNSLIVRPRLNDYHNILLLQKDVDFAIPFIDEDIPLYVDPFLLWKSPSMMDNGLHSSLIDSFNYLGFLINHGKEAEALSVLILASECEEVGLGTSKNKKGHRIGEATARLILQLFQKIPQLHECGFAHIEEIQLLVDGIAKDRISDISCNLLSSFFIDYTIEQCEKYHIPMTQIKLPRVYDVKLHRFVEEKVYLPTNPHNNIPIWFVPKRWLRYNNWLNPDDYFSNYYPENVDADNFFNDRIKILSFNRHNYDMVKGYVEHKERLMGDCKNDPLFMQIPVTSAKRKMASIKKLPSGKTDNSDKTYEKLISQLLASMLYPHLDFAKEQSRTESGVLIRDLMFYNNESIPFLKEIREKYGSTQIVFELKNVAELSRDHINQLNRYLNINTGNFGLFVTRNKPLAKIRKSLVDLWAGQRKCILVLDDSDIEMMTNIYDNKQRFPYEVINKKYVEFMMSCPS